MLGSFYSYWCRNKGLDQVIEKVPAPTVRYYCAIHPLLSTDIGARYILSFFREEGIKRLGLLLAKRVFTHGRTRSNEFIIL